MSKLITKAGNLELKIDVHHTRKSDQKTIQIWNKMGFSKLGGRNALQK